MTNIRYSNGSLFVQFADGDFSLTACNKEFAQKVVTLVNEGASKEEILIVLNPEFEKLQKEVEQIKQENQKVEQIVQSVLNDDRFYLENGRLYRQGIPISIPMVLADKIRQTIDEGNVDELNKLDKFWGWTSLIRNADSRESFYSYVEANDIPITKEGFIVAFRRANFVGKEQNKELVDFVTQEFMRLRKNKKSTNVDVWGCEDEDGNTIYSTKKQEDCSIVGNLKDLYTNLSEHEDVVFESVTANNQGQRLKYYIGKETRLNEDEVDWSDRECSQGIHCSNGGYNFSGYGNTPLAVAINPMDVVFAPYYDRSKMRVLAITPLCTLESDCDFELTPEIEEIVDEMMVNHLKRLEDIDNSFFKLGKEHTLLKEVPDIDISNFFSIVKQTVNPSLAKERYNKV